MIVGLLHLPHLLDRLHQNLPSRLRHPALRLLPVQLRAQPQQCGDRRSVLQLYPHSSFRVSVVPCIHQRDRRPVYSAYNGNLRKYSVYAANRLYLSKFFNDWLRLYEAGKLFDISTNAADYRLCSSCGAALA